MGKLCSACHTELSKAKFSSKQWSNNENKRRCKECTSSNISSRPLPERLLVDEQTAAVNSNNKPTFKLRKPIDYIDEDSAREKLTNFPNDISCWICLEEKNMSDRPLLRDCCCRGDHSGWAHYECLSKYATQQLDSDFDSFRNREAGTQPAQWYLKWTNCPNCNQCYENDLKLALSGKSAYHHFFIFIIDGHHSAGFVQYIEQKEGLFHIRDFLIVESYMTLLNGLKDAVHIDDSYFEEMEQVADKIIKRFLPNVKKATSIVPQQRQVELEADLHRIGLSFIATTNGDYAAAIKYDRHAISLFQLLISGAIDITYECSDYEAKVAFIEEDIAQLQKFMENGGDDNQVEEKVKEGEEEGRVLLEKYRRLYELSKRDGGEFSTSAITQGINYADLLHSHSVVKSSRLIKKLYSDSKRIFGPEHWVTEKAEEKLEVITHLSCSILEPIHGLMKFDVLAYDKKEDSYLLRVPDSDSINEEEGSENDRYKDMRNKTMVSPRRLCILTQIVPVAVMGLPQGPLEHLNGKIGETKMFFFSEEEEESDDPNMLKGYTIQFEDGNIEDCDIPPGNVFILAPQVKR